MANLIATYEETPKAKCLKISGPISEKVIDEYFKLKNPYTFAAKEGKADGQVRFLVESSESAKRLAEKVKPDMEKFGFSLDTGLL